MTLLRAAMAIRGEELHVAVWPGWWGMDGHLGAKRPEPGSRGCDVEPAVKAHAIESSVFVVSSSWYLPPGAPARLREAAERYEVRLERLEALAQEIARRLDSR